MLIPAHLIPHIGNMLILVRLKLAQGHGLSFYQMMVMSLLAASGSMALPKLRELVQVPRSTMTYLMRSLEGKELVERTRYSGDRRVQITQLSEKGKRLVEDIRRVEAVEAGSAMRMLEEEEGGPFFR